MQNLWKNLVIKWVNCFNVAEIKSIKEVKLINFLEVLNVEYNSSTSDPFEQLLNLLHNVFPNYDLASIDWTNDEELFLVTTLLLLYCSIYNPTEVLQKNAALVLDPVEQELVVSFMQKVIPYGQNLTSSDLIECLPKEQVSAGDKTHTESPMCVSPLSSKKPEGNRRTPLADFLSSPIAREKRTTGNFKDRLSQLENDLDCEQNDNMNLLTKLRDQDHQIMELEKRLKAKNSEVTLLQEELSQSEENCGILTKEKNELQLGKHKLIDELSINEAYTKQLETEMEDLKSLSGSLKKKLEIMEQNACDSEELIREIQEECGNLKRQVALREDENTELKLQNDSYKRDLYQLNNLSPRNCKGSPKRWSINSSPMPQPESLGFIVEKEMIDKENENLQLKTELADLEEKMKILSSAHCDLEQRAEKQRESSLRTQKNLEIKLSDLQKNYNQVFQELATCKREKDELGAKLSDYIRENESLLANLETLKSDKFSVQEEQRKLSELNHILEVKVGQLEAKLNMALEREEELNTIVKLRLEDLDNLTEERNNMEVRVKKVLKENSLLEQQLQETAKKLNLFKNVELQKDDLEDQLSTLKQNHTELEKKLMESSSNSKIMEEKLRSLLEEKRNVEYQLKDHALKIAELNSSLIQSREEKSSIASENVALHKEKVRWEAEHKEALQRTEEARDQILRKDAETKRAQEELIEALANNEVLSSKISILSQQESDLNSSLDDLVKQKKMLHNQLSVVLKDKERLEVELGDSSSELAYKVAELERVRETLLERENEVNALSLKLCDLSNSKSTVDTLLNEEKAQKKKLEAEFDEVVHKLECALAEVRTLNDELEKAKQSCEDKASAFNDLAKEKADVEDDLCHYVSNLNSTKQENMSLKSEVSLLVTQLQDLSEKCSDLSQANSHLEEEQSHLKAEILSIEDSKEKLSAELKLVLAERDLRVEELRQAEAQVSTLKNECAEIRDANQNLEQQLSIQISQSKDLLKEKEKMETDMSAKYRTLQYEYDDKSQQLRLYEVELSEKQALCNSLEQSKAKLLTEIEERNTANCALSEDVKKFKAEIETLSNEKLGYSKQLSEAQAEKEEILSWVETMEKEKKALYSDLQSESAIKEEALSKLLTAESLISQLQASDEEGKRLLLHCSEKLVMLEKCKDEVSKELESITTERDEMASLVEQLREDLSQSNERVNNLMANVDKAEEDSKSLRLELSEAKNEIKQLIDEKHSLHELLVKFRAREGENKQLIEQQQHLLSVAEEDLKALRIGTEEVNKLVDSKEEVDGLRNALNSLKEMLEAKDQIIASKEATIASLEKKTDDKEESALRLQVQQLQDELQSAVSTSNRLTQELSKLQEELEEEKVKSQKALNFIQEEPKSNQLSVENVLHETAHTSDDGQIAELKEEEIIWQLGRVKVQLKSWFDSIMSQKTDLERYLSQLRVIIDDATRVCDSIFSTLPSNCSAVHEIKFMRDEVETKLRAVDKKYAESLCGIITLAHDMFKCPVKQTELSPKESGFTSVDLVLLMRDKIESKVSVLREGMSSLTRDVQSVINSCTFLSERCESYLKAQTRESLKIKASFSKDDVDGIPYENPTPIGQLRERSLSLPRAAVKSKEVSSPASISNVCDTANSAEDGSHWFAGASTLKEAYDVLKSSHSDMEKQMSDLQNQLQEALLSVAQQSGKESELEVAKLKEKISELSQRPTLEQLDEKVKETKQEYTNRFEVLKAKMKKITQEEIDKIQEENAKLLKETVAKFNIRITGFEEHIKELSAQLWELGEKLLQEEQDHKVTKEALVTLKERQRQYVYSKHHTQSLDRLDLLMQAPEKRDSAAIPQRRMSSQSIQKGGVLSAKVRTRSETSQDDSISRQSTMMAPASMGLAFPEEDEDGEVFNNDYLAELKEGRCRAPLDGSRLSELHYRNSLCPPHLKSSYPLETQFHDPKMYREDDLKGIDGRGKRQGKDHGSTLYKKPGPPTPSKKGGRLSLQGKEDLSPRGALRECNESQTTQEKAMRVTKTTPSRLRSLFTSSKVANAASLPSTKRDQNSTPATPNSKRLSIFRRRFGGNKENQSTANTGYASFR